MLLRRVAIENVRSFLGRAELELDGPITIIIGPNGGGKTNLLDTVMVMLRRYLFATGYVVAAATSDQPDRLEIRQDENLSNLNLERHSQGADRDQKVEVEVEVTSSDVENMRTMQTDADRLTKQARRKYHNFDSYKAAAWKLSDIREGDRFKFTIINKQLQQGDATPASDFLEYLQLFEMDGRMREEFELAPLATPFVYLPVNRSNSGFPSSVELANYDDFQVKRSSDAAHSRNASQIVSLAVGRMAQKFRLLLEKDKGNAASEFRNDANLKELSVLLAELGYEWTLETISALKNKYDVKLTKQGSSFLVSAASSGEREILTYLFSIYALNVRNALIVVDEPELHLHPKWQKTLLQLFIRLTESTGNQFLLATHSPVFVSPDSIQYVSRVFSHEQMSHILRLNRTVLPEARHLLNIVNSQNNERLFFADEVLLVEGLSDRIFFESLLDRFGRSESSRSVLEVVSVGGKGFFEAYASVLEACRIKFSIIADLDYVEQVGSVEIKQLFIVDSREVKVDVVENVKSLDGDALVDAIEQAVATKTWDHAQVVWNYIKSRRRKLRTDLNTAESEQLQEFLALKRHERVFILERGSLEAYLPAGNSSKDLDKLIRLLSTNDYWERLPEPGKSELASIVELLLNLPSKGGESAVPGGVPRNNGN